MKGKERANPVQVLAEIGILGGLGFVLDELQSVYSRGLFINGGSIGIAMVAVFIMAYRRGFWAAIATGLVMSLLDTLTGPYILPGSFWSAVAQVGLDYVLAYPVVALAALFKPLFDKAETKKDKAKWLLLGCVVGGLAKFLIHFLAGIIFWGDPAYFAWDLTWMNPLAYVSLYNAAYMLPCIILSTAICLLVFWKAPSLYQDPNAIYMKIRRKQQ